MDEERITLTVLLAKGDKEWIAECVEYELIAQGATEELACKSFERVLSAQLMLDGMKMRRPLAGIKKDKSVSVERLSAARPAERTQLGSPPFRTSNMFSFRTLLAAQA